MLEFFVKDPSTTVLLAIFLICVVLIMRFFLNARSSMKENDRLRKKIIDLRFKINTIIASQRNGKISDCPSGVARPAKQPEFQLVLHQG